MELTEFLTRIKGGLIVSCQALPGEPLWGPEYMARMAVAAAQGGAVAIRANSPADIAAIKAAVQLPVIGLNKRTIPGFRPYITPSLRDVEAVCLAGADVVAVDATSFPHPDGGRGADFVRSIKRQFGIPVMADISTLAEGVAAAEAGADLISTTLAGYMRGRSERSGPDYRLVRTLVARVKVPVIAEGRISSPRQALRAIRSGAWAVVVGSAITRPQLVTSWYVQLLATGREAPLTEETS
ncbi:MAG: N-acetylmannosamine-6-phosphate 2-epimerase [Betaproteobacteria bacterium]